MKMPTLATNETKAKVEVKIRIIQEEEAVQEEEVEEYLIKEIFRAIIVKGMVTLKGRLG
jgi:tRNA-dihydrouridine synthase